MKFPSKILIPKSNLVNRQTRSNVIGGGGKKIASPAIDNDAVDIAAWINYAINNNIINAVPTNFTDKSVPYAAPDGSLTEENTSLRYHDTTNTLAVGFTDVSNVPNWRIVGAGVVGSFTEPSADSFKVAALVGSDMQILDANTSVISAPVTEYFAEGWDGSNRIDTQAGRTIGGYLWTIRRSGGLVRGWCSITAEAIDPSTDHAEMTVQLAYNDFLTFDSGDFSYTFHQKTSADEDSGSTVPAGILYVDANGKLLHTQSVNGSYTNDGTAAAGGVNVGQLYWNTTDSSVHARIT